MRRPVDGFNTAQALPDKNVAPEEQVKVRVDHMTADRMELTYSTPAAKTKKWSYLEDIKKQLDNPQSKRTSAEKKDLQAAIQAFGNKKWCRVTMGNAPSSGKIGEPQLPVVPTRLILAANHVIDKIRVKTGKKVKAQGQSVTKVPQVCSIAGHSSRRPPRAGCRAAAPRSVRRD